MYIRNNYSVYPKYLFRVSWITMWNIWKKWIGLNVNSACHTCLSNLRPTEQVKFIKFHFCVISSNNWCSFIPCDCETYKSFHNLLLSTNPLLIVICYIAWVGSWHTYTAVCCCTTCVQQQPIENRCTFLPLTTDQ